MSYSSSHSPWTWPNLQSSSRPPTRYSLPELLRKAMKGNLKGPLITIAMVTVLRVTYMALLGGRHGAPRDPGAPAGVAADDAGEEEGGPRAGGGHLPLVDSCQPGEPGRCCVHEEHGTGAMPLGRLCSAVWCRAAVLLCSSHGVLLPSNGQQGRGHGLCIRQDPYR
ncbi:Os09g0129500 [Oryza sativa Japonica Group]|uniref:Os09g0129500 protein n=1 Tax=Oryza sativa subsp. japonica TaxID=39947 RepID=Q0J3D4_ORYSJ|nr:Os09g0129500 [Oryza sativa Japonica Group]|eukprot:NP_001062617.1 Os09g0129500 [Oryza sativa Japonica Group]